MKTVSLKNVLNSEQELKNIVEILKSGGVVAYPSETCYGLLANFYDKEAVQKVFDLKKRPLEKKLLVLAKDKKQAEELVKFTSLGKCLAESFWPGPITLVLPQKNNKETLAVRVSDDELTSKILEASSLPLISTSANFSGSDPVYTSKKAAELNPDLLIDAGEIKKNPPTTIVDALGDKPKILRLGQISENDIFDKCEDSGAEA